MSKLPVKPRALVGLLREIRKGATDAKPLALGGSPALVATLREELARGGVAGSLREGSPGGAAALVYALAGAPTAADETALRDANRAKVPIVALVAGPLAAALPTIPYVPADRVVAAPAGAGLPVDDLGHVLAAVLGDAVTPLAARLPAIRRAACQTLISRCARQNGVAAVAIWVPGADLPVLTLNQVRLVLRLADAHGLEIDRERVPELLGVLGSGLGLRSLARQALGAVPFAGWAVKGGIAYSGTLALGEAALRYFEARAPVKRVDGERARTAV